MNNSLFEWSPTVTRYWGESFKSNGAEISEKQGGKMTVA